jgi:NTP pyrophosphatase (non-canonical NTP hydrolase)
MSDLVRDGHTAAGQREHDNVAPTGEIIEPPGQRVTRVLTIRKDAEIMDLEQFQQLMRDTYGERDRARGTAASVAWLTEEVGELAQSIRKGSADQQLEELADVLAWLASIADQLGLSLSTAAGRYADGCPRCGGSPCVCPM